MRLTPLALALAIAAQAEAAPLDIYILAGQSNMYGQGKWSELPVADCLAGRNQYRNHPRECWPRWLAW